MEGEGSRAPWLPAPPGVPGGLRGTWPLSVDPAALADARREADTDEVTGLGNRRALRRVLDGVEASRSGVTTRALLLVDLDGFREVNDTLGGHVGDELLRQVGDRVRGTVGHDVFVARVGGDRFALLLPAGRDGTAAVGAARMISQALGEAFDLECATVRISVRIGIAVAGVRPGDARALLPLADLALRRAKQARVDYQLYAGYTGGDGAELPDLVGELHAAVALPEQFEVHYQPQADLATGDVRTVEALVRWNHPSHGLVLPDDFVPVAEQVGLMRRLTAVVLDRAVRQCRVWHDAGLPLGVAVNLAASNLLDCRFPAQVDEHLRMVQLEPTSLTLEITENQLLGDRAPALEIVEALHELGVRLSIDDFGTGYSSLASLRTLPVDEIKLDRSFVTKMDERPADQTIVRAGIELGHSLHLTVVVEGVETRADWQLARSFGADVAQGYLLGRPVPARQLTHWFHEHRLRRVPLC